MTKFTELLHEYTEIAEDYSEVQLLEIIDKVIKCASEGKYCMEYDGYTHLMLNLDLCDIFGSENVNYCLNDRLLKITW